MLTGCFFLRKGVFFYNDELTIMSIIGWIIIFRVLNSINTMAYFITDLRSLAMFDNSILSGEFLSMP